MKMRISRYVHLFTRAEKYYLYNIETSFYCEIDKKLYKLLKDRDLDGLDEEEMLLLKQKKVLIFEDELDNYVLEAGFKFRVNSCNQDTLTLVIAPTTACNFACSYCFEENKKSTIISDEVIEKLIVFINEHIKAKQLEIVWYGGEPLLAFAQIKKIIASIEDNVKIPISNQRLITNGYLLSPEVIDFFQKKKLTAIQVTLDGDRDSHNKTRYTKVDCKSTFDTIINNVDILLSQMPNTRVTVRVNVNSENKDVFFPLYKELSMRWKGKNIYIYPGLIRIDTKDKLSLCSSCITDNNATDFYNELKLQGANLKYYLKQVDKGCMANAMNAYIVGPMGEIYKCWNDVSNPDKIIGYIDKREIINKTLFYRYMTDTNPFEDTICLKCSFLPICSGGCAWYRYRNKYSNGQFSLCTIYRDFKTLEDALFSNLERDKANELLEIDI